MEYGEGLLKLIGISPNWIPAASIILQWLMSVISSILLFCLNYKFVGRQKAIALIFLDGGISYMGMYYKYFSNVEPIPSVICMIFGITLIFLFGATFFGPNNDDKDDGNKNPDPTPDPGNKKIVDDFLKSCQKEFLAGLKK